MPFLFILLSLFLLLNKLKHIYNLIQSYEINLLLQDLVTLFFEKNLPFPIH